MILKILTLILLIPAVLAAGYHLVLALVGLALRRQPGTLGGECTHRFAIVIPAHDEETVLPGVLQSCAELDYPRDRFTVFVIADNCSDRTADVAIAQGVRCLERVDPVRRGKGQALEWALPMVLQAEVDAVLVIDADCRLDRQVLRVLDQPLAAGKAVLQASCVVGNPDASMFSYASAVTNLLENDLFYAPKSHLGLAVLLRGTGMVFKREVLERWPWQSRSIVEDAEYTERLFEAGQRVTFVPQARVYSEFPEQSGQLAVQRRRWIGGKLQFARKHIVKWLAEGIFQGRPVAIDLAWTFVAAARSLLLLELLFVLLLAGLSAWLFPGAFSGVMLGLALATASVHAGLLILGMALLGLSPHRLSLLAGAPRVAARFLLIAGKALLGGTQTWERTPR